MAENLWKWTCLAWTRVVSISFSTFGFVRMSDPLVSVCTGAEERPTLPISRLTLNETSGRLVTLVRATQQTGRSQTRGDTQTQLGGSIQANVPDGNKMARGQFQMAATRSGPCHCEQPETCNCIKRRTLHNRILRRSDWSIRPLKRFA